MVIDDIGLGPIVQSWNAFVIGLLVAAIITLPIFRLLQRVGSRQRISQHIPEHAKKQGTPTMGGWIVLFGAFAAIWLAHEIDTRAKSVLSLAAAAFALIGLFDDFLLPRRSEGSRGFRWLPKLAFQVVAALIFPMLGSEQMPGPATIFWQVFLILFFANAYNFADGMDGLAGGILIFLAIGACAMGLVFQSPLVLVLTAALGGAVIPFLWLNAPPAKVFMGDVGSMPIGFLLGVVAIDLIVRAPGIAEGSAALVVGLVLWAGVLIAELVPVPIQILSVKLTGRRVFPKTPIHHAFESNGVAETRVVWGFVLAQCVLSGLAAGWLITTVAGTKP